MNFWKQVPIATKIYLAILASLVTILVSLVIVRVSNKSIQESTLWRLITRQQNNVKATGSPMVASLVATVTFPPGSALLHPTNNISILDGPGDQYQVIAFLEKDQTARIVGVSQDKNWWAIELPYFSIGRGWVSTEKVQVENAENVQIVLQETATPSDVKENGNDATVMAIANVNVRSGPDTRFMKIGNIKKGRTAEVLGVSEDRYWWLIKLPDTKNVQGWISRDYVVARNADNVPVVGPASAAEQTLAPGSPYLVAVMGVNVRAGPDITYAIVGQLTQGQLAEIVGTTRDGLWWQIKYPATDSDTGWVAAAYVKAENTGSVPVVTQ